MFVELGNHDCAVETIDERPNVTTMQIPEFSDPEAPHYRHQPISAREFKDHLSDAMSYNQGITRLPGHEAALSIIAAWPKLGRGRPAWVKVHDQLGLTPDGQSAELEKFLSEYYEVPSLPEYYKGDHETAQVKKELEYWTHAGAPGEFFNDKPRLPNAQAVYMVDGRIMDNSGDGGSQGYLGSSGAPMSTGTAATSTTLTTSQNYTLNQWTGYRVVCYSTTGTAIVWGNIITNTAGAASVLTIDQWYKVATPGDNPTAAVNPTTPWAYAILDGGMTSTWFAGLATGANAPVNTDHTLATNGNVEYPTAAGGLYRKICPTATVVSASARTVVLVPVWTANGSDTGLPRTITTIGFFASMVPGFGGAGGPMKFETALTPSSAVISASGDQLTVTETVSGS